MNLTGNPGVSDCIKFWHRPRLRGDPRSPSIAGLIHFGERCPAQPGIDESGREGIAGPYRIRNFDGNTWVAMVGVSRDKEAPFAAHCDRDKLKRVLPENGSRSFEYSSIAGCSGLLEIEHREDLRELYLVQLEDRG